MRRAGGAPSRAARGRRKGRVGPARPQVFNVRFPASAEFKAKIERFAEVIGVFDVAGKLAELLEQAVDLALEKKDPKKKLENEEMTKNEVSTEKTLETCLVINVLMVAAIFIILSLALLQDTPPSVLNLGTLIIISTIEIVIGLAIATILFRKKKTWSRRLHPVYAFSASLNMIQAILIACVLISGFI